MRATCEGNGFLFAEGLDTIEALHKPLQSRRASPPEAEGIRAYTVERPQ